MRNRVVIVVALYAAVTLVCALIAPHLYVALPYGRAPTPLLNGVMSLLGPGVGALDIHGWPFWIALAVLFTLPWFVGYAATRKRWVCAVAVIFWIASGGLLASFFT